MQEYHIENRSTLFGSVNNDFRNTWLMVLFVFFSLSSVSAFYYQDDQPLKTVASLTCTQLENGQLMITSRLRVRVDRQYEALPNAEVEFYKLTDSTNILLGKKVTNKKGIAELPINTNEILQVDEEGNYGIMISYQGGEKYKDSEADLSFRPANLEMELSEEDSVRKVIVRLIDQGEDGPGLEDIEVVLEVPRMYSNLKIATEYTDEEGVVEIEFPSDLPGGENGGLLIIAKAVETDNYASLTNQVEKNWGLPVSQINAVSKGQLWSPDAPTWMVLIFAFLMALVWGHFFIIIYKLFLIRKEGKALIKENS